jgi:hypothetical protein
MRTLAMQSTAMLETPRLRLVPRETGQRLQMRPSMSPRRAPVATRTSEPVGERAQATARASVRSQSPVLLAGGKPSSRAALVRDLTATMSSSARFDEATAASELLALAPDSRMVVLSGDLRDISAKSAVQMLAHRHPELPVVRLDART